ncbi:hypothetical protein [Brevibacillus parabrevis]|uniref:hypothetical protein n=1 Tax=Brevibacillus parabrevis TaxID=54914 RepID=UPI0028D8DB66|nr:hypothetical protein [Brevibacillus parabrevis]
MNDTELRSALLCFQKQYGTSITFIANKCGISREHLSRWINQSDYHISNELRRKIQSIIVMY